jgi:hypothetical protein
MRKTFFLMVGVILAGCSHYDGFVNKHASTSYSFFVPARQADAQAVLFHAAYEICLKNHKSGFAIDTQTRQEEAETVETIITCKGPVDPLLAKKHAKTALQMDANEDPLHPTYRWQFKFIPIKP